MKNKFFAFFILLSIIFVSILIVIIPTFDSEKLSRKSLHKELNLELLLKGQKDIELVFFGYSACSDVCSPRLTTIAQYYKLINLKHKNRIGIKFLDISVPVDKTLPQRYAEFFHPEFQGIYLSNTILREYTKAFSVYFSPSLFDKGQYQHTGNLYVIKRTNGLKYLRYVYNSYPYDFEQLNKDIKGLLNES